VRTLRPERDFNGNIRLGANWIGCPADTREQERGEEKSNGDRIREGG